MPRSDQHWRRKNNLAAGNLDSPSLLDFYSRHGQAAENRRTRLSNFEYPGAWGPFFNPAHYPATSATPRNETRIPPTQSVPNFVVSGQKVNRFKVFVIGGGGIFADDHAPLFQDMFAEAITVPIAVMGVGAK